MAKIRIDVTGEHTIKLPPEQAVLAVAVTLEGGDATEVAAEVNRQVSGLRELFDTMYVAELGPITAYSVDQVRTWAHRPGNSDGVQLPLVHTARVDARATFVNFEAAGRFLQEATRVDGFTIEHVVWSLTDHTRMVTERDARQEAVRSARSIAQDYADALSLGKVKVRRIRGSGASYAEPAGRMALKSVALGDDADPDGGDLLVPDDIEVTSTVTARFVAT